MHRTRSLSALAALLLLTAASTAAATTEVPSPYDARSAAMGGTGVAAAQNATAVFHNVAGLQTIGQLSLNATFAPAVATLSAPVISPNTSLSTSSQLVPMFFLGGAYRLGSFVVAVGAYPTGGFGGTYKNVAALGGQDLKLQVATGELSPAVSYTLVEGLSIGVGYRISYFSESTSLPLGAPPAVVIASQSLSGVNFLGVQAGIHYQATKSLRLGFAYRSKVTNSLSGNTSIAGAPDMSTTSKISTPHELKLGSALKLLDDRLTLALDLKLLLYADSNKEIETTVGGQTTATPLDWNNVVAGGLGGEYFLSDLFAVRAGYSMSTSATPSSRPSPFLLPPSVVYALHLGAGLRFEHWDFDLGGYYSCAGTDVAQSSTALAGHYAVTYVQGSLSATYRM